MSALIEVILPVFFVIGFGYLARRVLGASQTLFEGAMAFAQSYALPVLLFRGISNLHLGETFDPLMLTAFYTGVVAGFLAGLFGARVLFHRPWPDSVAVAFAAAFSNGGLLGLPITERAYGSEALAYNFAIIAFHAPFVYLIATTAMEIVRAGGRSLGATVLSVLRAMSRNPMLIGIVLGALWNVTGLTMPGAAANAVDLVAAAAIPTALFGLGGILATYRPEGDLRLVAWIAAVSLLMHPAITYGLGHAFALSQGAIRSSVLMAAMAPGVNAYVFASLYGVAKRITASAVLVGTAGSILTAWAWLWVLG